MKKSGSITLRRDKKGPLKFNGERAGSATRTEELDLIEGESKTYEISARLFRTESGKYILGVEIYNRTDECYHSRDGWVSSSLAEMLQEVAPGSGNLGVVGGWLDNDILAEVFEDTEIADQFVERID
jgi:hypothetical protein